MSSIKKYLPPFPFVLTFAFVGGILWLSGYIGHACGRFALYEDDKLCVTEGGHSFYEQHFTGGGGEAQYFDVIIKDGNAAPTRITYDVPGEGLAWVQMVSPNAVNVVFGSHARGFQYFWEYDRRTRKVIRFQPSSGRLVTLLPSGDEVLMMDDEGLYVADTYLREQKRFALHLEDEYLVASAPSPGGEYVALATWNAQYEEADAKWRVYLLDLRRESIVPLGEAPYTEQLLWKDGRSFVTVTGGIAGAPGGRQEGEMFTVDSDKL
jgi:hypothetical protein